MGDKLTYHVYYQSWTLLYAVDCMAASIFCPPSAATAYTLPLHTFLPLPAPPPPPHPPKSPAPPPPYPPFC